MSGSLSIIARVLPVIFLIILGNVLQRVRFFTRDTIGGLKKLVVSLSLPALLFSAFAETAFEPGYLLVFIAVAAVCLVMLCIGKLVRRLYRSGNTYLPTLFSGFETGMMGYSIFVAVYGSARMYTLAVVDLGQVAFVFFILVQYIERLNGRMSGFRHLVKSFLTSPVILAILAGIAAGSLGIIGPLRAHPVSRSLLDFLSLVAGLTVPVICLIIGSELQLKIKGMGLPLLTAVLRTALLLGFAFLLNTFLIDRVLHLDRMFRIAVYTMFILPPPFVIPIYMKAASDEDSRFVLNTISVNILVSLAAYVILITTVR